MEVSRLGLGLAEIPRWEKSRELRDTEQVANAALDGGINFLDAAACYATTEESIGPDGVPPSR